MTTLDLSGENHTEKSENDGQYDSDLENNHRTLHVKVPIEIDSLKIDMLSPKVSMFKSNILVLQQVDYYRELCYKAGFTKEDVKYWVAKYEKEGHQFQDIFGPEPDE